MAWLGSWAKRVKGTLDSAGSKVSSDLTHFAVPLKLSTSCGIGSDDMSGVFDEVGSSFLKIAITESDGTTELYGEVEKWDDTAEEALIWVSKSDWTISSSIDEEIYIYYDSTQSDNTTYIGTPGTRTEVWDDNYIGVFHLGDAGSTVINSIGSDDGTFGGNVSQIDGPLAKASYLNNGYFSFDTIDFDYTQGTIECLVQIITAKTSNFLFCEQGIGNNNHEIEMYVEGDNDLRSIIWYGRSKAEEAASLTLSVDSTWHNISFGWDAAEMSTFKDGTKESSVISPSLPAFGAGTLYAGSRPGLSPIAEMYLDEYRVSNVRRSDAWRNTDYNAWFDNLISWGSEELGEPTLAIDSATNITKSSATIIGWLINLFKYDSLDLYFEWGKTTSYGSTTTPETKTEPATLSANLSGLERNQVYHFRLVAEDGEDTWYSDDASFYTLPASPVPQLKPSGGTFITNPFKGRQQGSFVGDVNYLNNKPYYNLKDSVKDFYTKPVRYLVNSNQVESAFEKPYLDLEYPQMHLNLPLQDWPIDPWPEPKPNPLPPGKGGGLHDTCLACNLVGSGHHTAKCGNEIVGLIHIFPIRFCTSFPYTNEDCQLVIETLDGGIISEMPGMFGWNISRYIIVTPLIERHTIRATFTDGTGNICTAMVSQKCDKTDCCTLFPDGMFTGFDEENSAETIGYGSPATLYVLGGCPPFQYQINSDGYFFDYKFTKTKLETNARYVTVYSINAPCGEVEPICEVAVADHCGRHQKPPKWTPYTYYGRGQNVSRPDGEYHCMESHTSSSDFYQDEALDYWFFEGSPADELFYYHIKNDLGYWKACYSRIIGGCDGYPTAYIDFSFGDGLYNKGLYRFAYNCREGGASTGYAWPEGSANCVAEGGQIVPHPAKMCDRLCSCDMYYWTCLK